MAASRTALARAGRQLEAAVAVVEGHFYTTKPPPKLQTAEELAAGLVVALG